MSSRPGQFIGRAGELTRLKDVVAQFSAAPGSDCGLEIMSISGSGGVGKTYLLDTVLQDSREALCQSLVIRIDASNENVLKEFTMVVDQMMAPLDLPPPAKAKHDYFPATRQLLGRQRELVGMVESEVSNNKALGEDAKGMAKALYRLSPALKYIPKVGPLAAMAVEGLQAVEAEKYVEPALEALGKLKALSDKVGWFTNPLAKRRFTALRHSPFEAFGDVYLSDITAMLHSYRSEDRWVRFTHSGIKGLDRLVLIVDDFEAVGPLIGPLLAQNILPKLKNAPFSTLAIILGRDDVLDADKEFAHHLLGNLKHQIRLEPFSQEEGVQYLVEGGYTEKEALHWYKEVRGLPFILRLLVENRSDEDKQSAIFFKRFYERTTRWMTVEERRWLTPICYLDKVNEGAIKALMPNENASRVMAWFVREASVRDVRSADFAITPYIRHMLLEYNRRIVGDAGHAELKKLAKKAMDRA